MPGPHLCSQKEQTNRAARRETEFEAVQDCKVHLIPLSSPLCCQVTCDMQQLARKQPNREVVMPKTQA